MTVNVPRRIGIHNSASNWGDASVITAWHLARGFNDIGYHYVVLNGWRVSSAHGGVYVPEDDAAVESGRPIGVVPAHIKGHNDGWAAICMIGEKSYASGRDSFTVKQLSKTVQLTRLLMATYNIPKSEVYGHRDFSTKTCPDFSTDVFRAML